MNAAPNFDGLARIYRWLEFATFGPALWRCRCSFLEEVRDCRRALVLGDGDGRFTARLLETNPDVRIDAVDASPAMLRALVKQAGTNSDRVCTCCADVREHQFTGTTYDLVVTHFFLDCLTTGEVAALARQLKGCLSPHAYWLISEFAVPQGMFGALIARPLVSALYWMFRGLTGLRVSSLPQYKQTLGEIGFKYKQNKGFLGSLLAAELWSAESISCYNHVKIASQRD